MAKVNVEYDTNEKTAACHIDGKPVENFHSLSLSKRYKDKPDDPDTFYLDLHQAEKNDEHDMVTHHHTMASERVPPGAKDVQDSPDLPGFKVVSEQKPAPKPKV